LTNAPQNTKLITYTNGYTKFVKFEWDTVKNELNIELVIVYVERGEDRIRIVSARSANKYERGRYEQFLQDGLGAS